MGGFIPLLADDESIVNGEIIKDADIQSNLLVFEYNPSLNDVIKIANDLFNRAHRAQNSRREVFSKKIAVINSLNFIAVNLAHFNEENGTEIIRNTYPHKISELYEKRNISKNEYDHFMIFLQL